MIVIPNASVSRYCGMIIWFPFQLFNAWIEKQRHSHLRSLTISNRRESKSINTRTNDRPWM